MLCLDNPSDLVLQGPGSSLREKTLSLKIDWCINHDSCSDSVAIDQFIENNILTIIRNN